MRMNLTKQEWLECAGSAFIGLIAVWFLIVSMWVVFG